MRRALLAVLAAALGFAVWPAAPAVALDAGDRIYADEYLEVGDTLTSPAGQFTLVVQADGNVVIYSRSWQPQWSTGTRGTDNWLYFDAYEGFEVYSATDELLWRGGPPYSYMSHAALQDDGNLVMFDAFDGRAVWSRTTGTINRPAPPRPLPAPVLRGDRLGAGDALGSNEFLAIGGWRAIVQPDGNFVVYANGAAQWSSRTGRPTPTWASTLVVQADGNAVLYSYGHADWNSGTAGGPSTMVLQADGNLVVYGADGRARWSRTTGPIR